MRYFVEVPALGCPIRYMDVGGGLGVDYEGTRSWVSAEAACYQPMSVTHDEAAANANHSHVAPSNLHFSRTLAEEVRC